MFFGLTNSPATFQTMMNALFKDLITQGHVRIYMDDILIFTSDLTLHRSIVSKVLQILQDNQLYLKPEKCDWEQEKVEYLGLLVSKGSVRMDPVKIQAVKDWPTPKSKKDVQIFLGFVNFYRRFVQNMGSISRPLTRLTGKVNWLWTPLCQIASDRLRDAVTSSPILAIPQEGGKYKLEADASDYAMGAVLYQWQNGQWRVVGYMSKGMTDAERNC
jgi:hypothetical protein